MEQWEIQRSAGKCAGTGKILEPGEEYYAALVDKKTNFERCDYSRQYWQEKKPEVFFGHHSSPLSAGGDIFGKQPL